MKVELEKKDGTIHMANIKTFKLICDKDICMRCGFCLKCEHKSCCPSYYGESFEKHQLPFIRIDDPRNPEYADSS